MVLVLNYTLTFMAFVILVPIAVLFAEILLAVLLRSRPMQLAARPRLAILMPAHNESILISRSLQSLTSELLAGDRILVVADNCSDDTAMMARLAGAQVIIRSDPDRRGKGFALDFGIRYLESDPPEVLIVIDADCTVAPGSIDRLSRSCAFSGRPTQALYLMRSPPNSNVKSKISEFAWVVKNQLRPAGLQAIGLPCHLAGSGMAFPWTLLRSFDLATDHIVEDLKLGIEMTRAGAAPMYCPEAIIMSEFPLSDDGQRQQRTRWEHGHLKIILSEAPRSILQAIRRFDLDLLALALDVIVPPLALLTLVLMAVWAATCIFLFAFRGTLPVEIASGACVLMAAAISLSWLKYGRRILSLRELGQGLFYAMRKFPVYKQFLVARQAAWVRSKRHDGL